LLTLVALLTDTYYNGNYDSRAPLSAGVTVLELFASSSLIPIDSITGATFFMYNVVHVIVIDTYYNGNYKAVLPSALGSRSSGSSLRVATAVMRPLGRPSRIPGFADPGVLRARVEAPFAR